MEERKHIDRLFQEKFKDFESHPREKVWENIHARLQNKKKQRSWFHSTWSRAAGVAAALAIIFLIGDWFSRSVSPEVATQINEQQDQREPKILPVTESAFAEVEHVEPSKASMQVKNYKSPPAPAERPRVEVVHQKSHMKSNGILPSQNVVAIFLDPTESEDILYVETRELEINGVSIFDAMESTHPPRC